MDAELQTINLVNHTGQVVQPSTWWFRQPGSCGWWNVLYATCIVAVGTDFTLVIIMVLLGKQMSNKSTSMQLLLSTEFKQKESTQHNSTSPVPPLPQRHTDTAPPCHGNTCISTSLSTVLCGRSTSSPPACTVSAAATQGLTLTQSRCPPPV